MTDTKRYGASGEIKKSSVPEATWLVEEATAPFRDMLTRLQAGGWASPGLDASLQRSARQLDNDIADVESVLLILLQQARRLGGQYGQEVE